MILPLISGALVVIALVEQVVLWTYTWMGESDRVARRNWMSSSLVLTQQNMK